MPADRTRQKRGTDAVHPSSWSLQPKAPTAIAFATNITPGTFNDPPSPTDEPAESLLFPSSAAAGKKSGHSKKKGADHIPRPPNAFILFRSSFIKSQHVSTEVETNHSTLSKIIGLTWQNLPPDERQVWHAKAKAALDEHKRKWPTYAFRPLHPKHKARDASGAEKAGDARRATPKERRKVKEIGQKDLTRCAKIAELLVEGKKGSALNAAMAEFDKTHVPPAIIPRFEEPLTVRAYRRSSSAPIPDTEHSRKSQSFLPSTPPQSARRLRSSSSEPEGSRACADEPEFDPSMPPLVDNPNPPMYDLEFSPCGDYTFSWLQPADSMQACDFSAAPNPEFCFDQFTFDHRIPTPLSMQHSYSSGPDPCDPSPVSAGPLDAPQFHAHEQPGLMAPHPFDPRGLSIDTSFGGYHPMDSSSSPYSSVPGSPGGFAPSTPGYDAPGTPSSYAPTPDELLAAFSQCGPYANLPYAPSPAPTNLSYDAPSYHHTHTPSPGPADYSAMFGTFQAEPSKAEYAFAYGGAQQQQHPLLYNCAQPSLAQLDPAALSNYMAGLPSSYA